MKPATDSIKEFASPLITVIMPVFNSETYLNKAIESVLFQTFSDFEFIIVNDGSTDGSEKIILSYSDKRIVYIKNPINFGLITTLNNTIQLAKGKYIARMDNDDMCLPNRFEIQLNYFKLNAKAKMVCSPIQFINSNDQDAGFWPADKNATSYSQIVNTLPWENCIAHPTIMIERDLIQKYKYSLNQKGSEDWDLWLRMVRDKVQLIKTSETLLKYRIHDNSFTRRYNSAKSPQVKAAAVKLKFVLNSLKELKLNYFVMKTGLTIYKDLGYHIKTNVLPGFLKKIKWFFTINPFKAFSQWTLLKRSLNTHHSHHFLFFPYSHIGGAEKVHADITKVAASQIPFVFITGLSDSGAFFEQFGNNCVLLPVAKALYHPLFSASSEKMILSKINLLRHAYVFGCNNLFFYNLILKLNPNVFVADLTHDFNYVRDKKFAIANLPNYLRCDQRVFISNSTLKRTLDFYDANFADEKFKERISLIYNYVNQPLQPLARKAQKPYRILYVGRDTIEKRVDIIFELALECEKMQLPFEFVFAGPVKKREKYKYLKKVIFEGMIKDEAKLSAIYGNSHFIIISSESEGFPLTIAEGMIHGCIPISTAVGDIPFHIKHTENGFLCEGIQSAEVVNSMAGLLMAIVQNHYDLNAISKQAQSYAATFFNKENFVSAYRKILKLD